MIELRWMKLKSAAADVKPVLQCRHFVAGGWSDWQMIPIVFTEYPNDESGATHSDRYGD